MKRRTVILAALAVIAAPLIAALPEEAHIIAITNARIVPVVGAEIPRGTILVEGGRIAAIGADVAVPAGARVVDATGLRAYPGMIDGYSSLGLVEISAVAATVDNRETGRINPQVRTLEAIRYDSMHIPISRSNGITAAIVAPSGGFVSGVSCLLKLDGWTHREMAVKPAAALHIELPGLRAARGGIAGGRRGALRPSPKGRRSWPSSKACSMPPGLTKSAGTRPPRTAVSPCRATTRRARACCRSSRASFRSWSPSTARRTSGPPRNSSATRTSRPSSTASSRVSRPPASWPRRGSPSSWARSTTCLRSGRTDTTPSSAIPGSWPRPGSRSPLVVERERRQGPPYHAAKAAAFGLDRGEALRAVTINTAEIFGVAGTMGSLEKGKAANIVLADGDILELRTNIAKVFIDGRETDLSNRYTELLEKFKK
ncbi:MAG: amidohydrolase family protein [Candidatus Moduliflexus flocculans]|nr:amidohydrolase family protein [Candidatus Moduliflexus flocculans]